MFLSHAFKAYPFLTHPIPCVHIKFKIFNYSAVIGVKIGLNGRHSALNTQQCHTLFFYFEYVWLGIAV